MSLDSPGVQISIVDESQYLPSPTSSTPFILLATAENKADPTSTRVAAGTTAENAGKLFRVTSQRDLVTLYGDPLFYRTSAGTPIQGYELNEYGLLAAYSALGASNSVFCLRADIDLDSLIGKIGRPSGDPANGTYWLDTDSSTWGIFEFNSVTGRLNLQDPIVITSESSIQNGAPLPSLGSIGDYAVIAIPTYDFATSPSSQQFFYKNDDNQWAPLGTQQWFSSHPTVTGTESDPEMNPGDTLTIGLSDNTELSFTFPTSPNNTVDWLVQDINDLGLLYLSAKSVDGKLVLFSGQTGGPQNAAPYRLIISGTGTVLDDLGIPEGSYFQPSLRVGTSAEIPAFGQGQLFPRPSGSVFIKVGSTGNGYNPSISEFNTSVVSFVPVDLSFANNDYDVIAKLDPSGGKNIEQGSVYVQYASSVGFPQAGPFYYWERFAEGPTVITGTTVNPQFQSAAPVIVKVRVTLPFGAFQQGSSLSDDFFVTLQDGDGATEFVTAWSAANIPFTSAEVTPDGRIRLTHTEGGVIVISDFQEDGFSAGVAATAGFSIGTTPGVKEGFYDNINIDATVSSTSGAGSLDATFNINNFFQSYGVNFVVNGGGGYTVGDTVLISGTDLGGSSPAGDLVLYVSSVDGGAIESVTIVSGSAAPKFTVQLSNWREFELTASAVAPNTGPRNNDNWFYSVIDEVDILVKTINGWQGYQNTNYDFNGFPALGPNATDPNGPIVSSTAPTEQSDGSNLVFGDLWIGTMDLENYPVIYRYQSVDGSGQWVRLDNTNNTDPEGVLFADARWAPDGTTNPVTDPIPSITALLTSDFLDVDAPNPALFPTGMLLFNTRRSGYNIKQFKVNYFNTSRFPDTVLPAQKDAWVTASGLDSDGSPFMGRKAQRAMVVKAMRATIDTNTNVRDEDNFFNLLAAPNYPELQPNMITLNADRGETGFIIGDTPLRLADDATSIQAWANNDARATSTSESGLVTRNSFMGLFYPSGIAPDLSGNLVAVPASHMMIRTMLRNDTISFPWLAPAGTRRGIIENATNVGYVNGRTGEFIVTRSRVGIRDVLYNNQINPLVFFTGNGLLNYGNKTSFDSLSSLDRINVARLVAFIRRQLTLATRPFVFEPNDSITRQQVSGVVETLFVDLVAKRGLNDYLVVCDESNNTPARIDRNELYIDIAIEPVKSIEFIFVPVRIFNTGELSGGSRG